MLTEVFLKNLIFLSLSLLSFSAFSECHTGSEGALNQYAEDEGIENKSILQSEQLSDGAFELYRVVNQDSCGVRGCDFGLYVMKENCLSSALSAYSAIMKKSQTWKTITVTSKSLPVDRPSKSQEYFFDKNTFSYILKK